MTYLSRLSLTVAAVAAIASLPLRAAGPSRWEVSSAEQWMAGKGDRVAVTRDGRLAIGPAVTVVHDASAPALWAATTGPDDTLYVGTGNEGQVLAVSGTTTRVLWDSDDLQVHALAWHDGALLAATSPDGKVYRIAADGTATVFFDPDDTYVWALAVDRQQQVYVATGGKGRVYRLPRTGGTATKVFESAAANVTAIAVADSGDLIVGTDSPGRLYRVPVAGKPFALLDGPFTQVQAIRPAADGTLWVLAVSPGAAPATPAAAPATPSPTPSVSTEVTVVAVGDTTTVTPVTSAPATPASPAGVRGAVYRVGGDGLADLYWEATGELPFDILPTGSGGLLVTADNGVVYAVDGSPARTARLAQVSGRQLTRIVAARGDRYLITASNPGKVLELSSASAASGSYTSEVKDATTGATWGLLRWEGTQPSGSTVRFATRSGNTSTPDDTWADWTPARDDAGQLRIASPPARYMQWKVDLTGTAAIDSVETTYLPRNQRPRVTGLTIHPPGVVFQQPYATQEPPDLAGFQSSAPAPARDQALAAATPTATTAAPVGRRLFQKGFQTLQWEALDPDKDDLRFEVGVRRIGQDGWRTLGSDLAGSVFAWDTSQLPDGRYMVRVLATDRRSNPTTTALAGEREAGPLVVDNTAPAITVTEPAAGGTGATATTAALAFEVVDATSTLDRVDILLRDGTWRALFPEDGALDGPRERFRVPMTELGAGPVVIRATDGLANLTTREVRLDGGTGSTARP